MTREKKMSYLTYFTNSKEDELSVRVLYVLPSRVCWSSKTWFINLVFSSISTWFSMSPEIDKNSDSIYTQLQHIV